MVEIRIHGTGGQGVVTAAELLSIAAFDEGHHAHAFPTFGSERMGAPVTAYCKGPGICAEECPCGAIAMEPEET